MDCTHNKPLLVLKIAALLCLGALSGIARGDDRIHFKPGHWVRLPEVVAGRIAVPGTATVVEDDRAGAQFVLPMTELWTAEEEGLELEPLPEGALLVGELNRTPKPGLPPDAVRAALPSRSAIIDLGDMPDRVPESVDLVLCYYFSESKLTSRAQAALARFVHEGGALALVFGDGSMPEGAKPVWQRLLGIEDGGERSFEGLPPALAVPDDFSPDIERVDDAPDGPTFLWKRHGRGVVLVYDTGGDDIPRSGASVEALARRLVATAEEHRRPVRLGPIERDVYGLFGRIGWSEQSRRHLAWLVGGYALAAVGLLVSVGGVVRRGWIRWLIGLVVIAGAGTGTLTLLLAGQSGLSLETHSVVFFCEDTGPVEMVIGRVARLGRGPSPEFRSADPMPPKVVLFDRFSAVQRDWAAYRFRAAWSSVEPLLEVGQSVALVAVRPLSTERAAAIAGAPDSPAPGPGDKLVELVRRSVTGHTFEHRWAEPDAASCLFAPGETGRFTQVRRHPALLIQGD